MARPDRLLNELNREWEEMHNQFELGSVVLPGTRHRTVDLTNTGRDLEIDPLAYYRIMRGRKG